MDASKLTLAFLSPGDRCNNDGDTVSLSVTTSYHGSGTLSYSATGLPPGLSINSSTGQMTGSIAATADMNSPYSVLVTASDGMASSSQSFTWAVSAINLVSPSDRTNNDGDAVNLSEYSHPSPPTFLPRTQGERGESERCAVRRASPARGLPAV